jgi:hypothetical protein
MFMDGFSFLGREGWIEKGDRVTGRRRSQSSKIFRIRKSRFVDDARIAGGKPYGITALNMTSRKKGW